MKQVVWNGDELLEVLGDVAYLWRLASIPAGLSDRICHGLVPSSILKLEHEPSTIASARSERFPFAQDF